MKAERKRLAVMVSGGGSNMQSVLDNIKAGKINADIVCVISSNTAAFALQRAKINNIPSFVCSLAEFGSAEKRDERVKKILKEYRADYVILAGYLGIITPLLIEEFPNKMLNIHPALLPSYGGKSYHGLQVHRAVIAAKEPFSGATVHFVDAGTDTGLIIAQKSMPVEPCDTPETLQEKILKNIEHVLYAQVIADLCDGKVRVENNKVIYEDS